MPPAGRTGKRKLVRGYRAKTAARKRSIA
jgi:hypothetical protein